MKTVNYIMITLLPIFLSACKSVDVGISAPPGLFLMSSEKVIEYCERRRVEQQKWARSQEAAEIVAQAAETGDLVVMKYLFSIGTSLNGLKQVPPAAAAAVLRNNLDSLRFLLSAGASPDITWQTEADGIESLLNIAYLHDAYEAAEILYQKGARKMPSENEPEKERKRIWLKKVLSGDTSQLERIAPR